MSSVRVCSGCGVAWRDRHARFCGRCRSALVAAVTPTVRIPQAVRVLRPVASVFAAGLLAAAVAHIDLTRMGVVMARTVGGCEVSARSRPAATPLLHPAEQGYLLISCHAARSLASQEGRRRRVRANRARSDLVSCMSCTWK